MSSGADSTGLSARFLGPSAYERGKANALSCPLYQSGALVPPTEAGSTVTIYEGSTVKVSAAAVTVTGSIATYNYTPAATEAFGDGWVEEWSLIVSGVTHVFRNDGAMVKRVLYNPITDADLFRRVSALDPSGSAPVSSLTDFQDFLDDAWSTVNRRLTNVGRRPWLIMSPSSLVDVCLSLTLARIFDDFATRLNETYSDRAREYKADYEAAWGDLRFIYDEDGDGVSTGTGERTGAAPSIWLTSR